MVFLWNCLIVLAQIPLRGRKFGWINLLQIPLSLFLGAMVDAFRALLFWLTPEQPALKLITMLCGVVILAFAISITVAAGTVMNAGEALQILWYYKEAFMKSCICFVMVFLLSFTYRGCSAPPAYGDDNPAFSYQEELLAYAEESTDVVRDGFVNTSELERAIDNNLDAADQAIKEYTLDQSSPYYQVFFDPDTRVWKVVFNYFDADAEKQAVYMSEKGKTLLIVYTE